MRRIYDLLMAHCELAHAYRDVRGELRWRCEHTDGQRQSMKRGPKVNVLERGWVMVATSTRTRKRVGSKLYWAWDSMKKRCYGTREKYQEGYRDRGITVCDAWRENYAAFRAWALANGFRKGLSIDRIDNDSGYWPDNCRWIPVGKQQENTRRTIQLTVNGITKPLPVWAREFGLSPDVVRSRVRLGWSPAQALTPMAKH